MNAKRADRSGGSLLVRREPDGELFDPDRGRVVRASELREHVRAGRRFRAVDRETGSDCTYAVLGLVLAGGTIGPRSAGRPETLPSLARGTVRDVLDWASDNLDAAGPARGDRGTPRGGRRRERHRRVSSNTGSG